MANTYVQIHGPVGERVQIFVDMDLAAITAAIVPPGIPFDVIDQASYDAFVIQRNAAQHADAVLLLTTDLSLLKLIRAALFGLLDEVNLLRQRDNDRSVDVAAATTLADLKTRWAARAAMPDRTPAQARTFIVNKINSGAAD